MRAAAPFLAVLCAVTVVGCGSSTSTAVTPLADSSFASGSATSSTTSTNTTTSTPTSAAPTTAAVAAGAGVGYGSGADEEVARRAVRAVAPATTRKAAPVQRAVPAPKPAPSTKAPAAKAPVAAKTTTKKATEPKTEQKAASGYSFANCSQAKAAGAAPLYAGQAGYAKKLDRDGDGVACET